jgi:hypothetical protein
MRSINIRMANVANDHRCNTHAPSDAREFGQATAVI